MHDKLLTVPMIVVVAFVSVADCTVQESHHTVMEEHKQVLV